MDKKQKEISKDKSHKAKRIMMIAGEASGESNGANVIKELKKIIPDIEVYGIGGPRMREAGVELIYHTQELSFMGIVEVIKHIPFVRKVFKSLEKILDERRPDLLILVDFPDFNLRVAEKAKKRGIPILYYISPQVWAWRKGRIKQIARLVDKMVVIFPFEVDIYKNAGVDVEFVGHPVLETVTSTIGKKDFFMHNGLKLNSPLIGLLPGSREQEIKRHLPVMIESAKKIREKIPDAQFIIGSTLETNLAIIYKIIEKKSFYVKVLRGKTYDIMRHSDALIVASGTATLESAYMETPMVVVYKVSFLTWLIGRMLIKLKNIGMVNILAEKRIVPELVQYQMTPDNLSKEILDILQNPDKQKEMKDELKTIKKKLGEKGSAKKTAEIIAKMLNIPQMITN